MAVHWQVKFKSLRNNTLYTVNIYDDNYTSNTPVQLTGAERPFTTEEDDDDDFFLPVRTQSGYIRIVTDMTNNQIEELLPATQVDRYVTLTHQVGQSTVIDWQGYMQPSNFGFPIYGPTREIEMPVQCILTSMQCQYVESTPWAGLQNFAFYIYRAFQSVNCNIRNFYFHNLCAENWLSLKIDQRMFLEDVNYNGVQGKYSQYDIISKIAEFFGWSVRMISDDVFFSCADEYATVSYSRLSLEDLHGLAYNMQYSVTPVSYHNYSLPTTGYASDNNEITLVRNTPNVTVLAKCERDSDILYLREGLIRFMRWEAQNGYSETYGDMLIEYTADIFTYPEDKMIEYEASLDASMNYCTIYKYNDNHVPEEREQFGVIRIYESYDPSNSNPFFTLKTRYSISLSNCFPAVGSAGYLRIKGDVYQKGKRVSTASFNRRIYVSVGIGTNHDNILWYSGDDEWTHVKHKFSMWVGLDDSEWWAEGIIRVPNNSNLTGQVIVEIYGSDNLEMIDGQRQFDIRDFSVTMDSPTEKNIFDSVRTGLPDRKVEIISEQTYSATQQIGNRDIVDISPVFASFNKFPFAKNFIMDSTGEYQRGIPYDLHDLTDLTHPEQYLADRISAFWTNARHLLKSEYILNTNTNANPVRIYTQDNKHYYPMVIAHDWRDDIVKLSLIEV